MKKLIVLFSLLFSGINFSQTHVVATGQTSSVNTTGFDAHIDDLGNHILMGNDANGLRLAKLDPNFNLLWSISNDEPTAALVDHHQAELVPLMSGEYLAHVHSNTTSYSQGSIVKFDTNGNILWDKKLDTSHWANQILDVVELPNTNVLLLVRSQQERGLICLDPNGNNLWTKLIEAPQSTHSFAGSANDSQLLVCSDNTVLIVANVSIFGSGQPSRLYLAKLDLNANVIWEKYYENSEGYEYTKSVIESTDGYFYTLGTYNVVGNPGLDSNDVIVHKFDTSGTWLTSKEFGGNHWDLAGDIIECPDGNLILSTLNFGVPNCTYLLGVIFKINTNLDTVWTKVVGSDTDGGLELLHLRRKGPIIYSYAQSSTWNQFMPADAVLIKTDQNFDIPCYEVPDSLYEWDTPPLNTITSDILYSNGNIPLYDNGNWTSSTFQILDGCTGQPVDTTYSIGMNELAQTPIQIQCYPNPVSQFLIIESIDLNEITSLSIYNTIGQLVLNHYIKNSGSMEILNLENLETGYYILEFMSKQGELYSKNIMKL